MVLLLDSIFLDVLSACIVALFYRCVMIKELLQYCWLVSKRHFIALVRYYMTQANSISQQHIAALPPRCASICRG